MSTALAIAGVTAVLRDLLNDGMINRNVSAVVGATVSVRAGPPDRVNPATGPEPTLLNLFMHQATPNAAWRNHGLPSHDRGGRQRLSNPPLALDLHYLVSAYGAEDLHAEILLGYAMQLFHENPVLGREAIRTALSPSPGTGAVLPPALRALAECGLADQYEQIRITPATQDTEAVSRLWSALQANYRPSAAYQVSVVLIEATRATRSPLPVLTRGRVEPPDMREPGVMVQASLVSPLPTVQRVLGLDDEPAARLGDPIVLEGLNLDGSAREVLLDNERFAVSAVIAAAGAAAPDRLAFAVPAARAAEFPAGLYRVAARLVLPDETASRETNRVALLVLPAIGGLPLDIVRDAGGTASFTLAVTPQVRPGQQVTLFLGQQSVAPEPVTTSTGSLQFVVPSAPVGDHLARLRIDGVDSPVIDRSVVPPRFFDQRIRIS